MCFLHFGRAQPQVKAKKPVVSRAYEYPSIQWLTVPPHVNPVDGRTEVEAR